jgi:hypothetical protein
MARDEVGLPQDAPFCSFKIAYCTQIRDIETKAPLCTCTSPIKSAEELKKQFAAALILWEQSVEGIAFRNLFVRLLKNNMLATKIKKVVGFALGSPSCGPAHPTAQDNSLHQHVLLVSILSFFNTAVERSIPCFIQDPIYTQADEQCFSDHGIMVLKDPEGFLEIDNETFVLSIYPDIPVKQIVFDIVKPALLLWNTIKVDEEIGFAYSFLRISEKLCAN